MTTATEPEAFDQHCVIELLGHRRLAGRVREAQIAGAGFLRIDIPATDGYPEQTDYVSPSAVYALHPVDAATAAKVAAHCRPEPVHRWELESRPARADGPWDGSALDGDPIGGGHEPF